MAQERKTNEDVVRELDDAERIAAGTRDVPALERLWSEHLTVNAQNNKVVVGRKAVLDAFVHSGIINFATFERQVELVRADGDLVIIMGMDTVQPLSDVWKKEGAAWRLFARHANVIPRR